MALVLYTGTDASLMETRKLILERAGHTVIAAMTFPDVNKACLVNRFDVAVIGQIISPAMKLQVAEMVRQLCPAVKILELYTAGDRSSLASADAVLQMPTVEPSEVAAVVSRLSLLRVR